MKNNNPVYQTIYMHLRDQIVDGELLPGQILPSENELCRRFSTTRETVRRGLTQLTQEGLVYSRPKRGYFVREPKNNDLSLTISPKITESISRFKDIRLIRPNIELQNALQIPSDQRIIAIYRGSYRDEFQVGLEIKYLPYDKGIPSIENEINYAVFPEAANAKTDSFSYYTQLEISAVSPVPDLLPLLECKKNEPLLLISRIFITQDGKRIGFSKEYLRQPYGSLSGYSGYIQNRQDSVDASQEGSHA